MAAQDQKPTHSRQKEQASSFRSPGNQDKALFLQVSANADTGQGSQGAKRDIHDPKQFIAACCGNDDPAQPGTEKGTHLMAREEQAVSKKRRPRTADRRPLCSPSVILFFLMFVVKFAAGRVQERGSQIADRSLQIADCLVGRQQKTQTAVRRPQNA
jgi:hypothetical protein